MGWRSEWVRGMGPWQTHTTVGVTVNSGAAAATFNGARYLQDSDTNQKTPPRQRHLLQKLAKGEWGDASGGNGGGEYSPFVSLPSWHEERQDRCRQQQEEQEQEQEQQ